VGVLAALASACGGHLDPDWLGDGGDAAAPPEPSVPPAEPGTGGDPPGDAGGGGDPPAAPDPCGGDCTAGLHTACTCEPYDPCGWVGNGVCSDRVCEALRPGNHFDDGADCGTAPSPCGDACARGEYDSCTCGPGDPCGWAGNGICNDPCSAILPVDHFDDSADCGTAAPPAPATLCGGACARLEYDSCTCGADDPCRWAGDGYCDDRCYAIAPSSHLDDSVDCRAAPPAPCGGACARLQYDSCTCGADDPCRWAGDGGCDDRCYTLFPSSHFDDSADCGSPSPPPACDGDCAARRYTACTCGTADPCGWARNGTCDDACAGVAGADFDDSADCAAPPPATGRTFIVTAVRGDGLDQGDMEVMAEGLAGLGYAEVAHDDYVSTRTLAGYLARDATTLYHTGHGVEGAVMTSDGSLGVGDARIGVRNAIFGTCLTLYYSWASAFGADTETVLGYTKVSFDWTDNDVARAFVSQLGAGRGYMAAWYQANAAESSLSDRWAGYVREGDTVVEYSARTGRRPSDPLRATWVALGGTDDVFATADVLADERSFEGAFVDVRAVAPAEWSTEMDVAEFGALGPTALSLADAEALARAWVEAHGGLPADAVVDGVTPVVRRTSAEDPGAIVGHVVRYVRVVHGVPVRANLAADHAALLVGPSSVVAASRIWPEVAAGAEPCCAGRVLTVARAVEAAAPSLARLVKGLEVRIVGAEPVYGVSGARAELRAYVPAYALLTTNGVSVVISALTGEPLF
jgi:hypothetical protein